MSSARGYYRHPTIHDNTVVFVSEDDLWSVRVNGGTARRLTASPGVSQFPAISPDGEWIAYTGEDDGPAEVYVMPLEGGPSRRLTWMGANTQVVGWSRDGRSVLAATDWRQPFAGRMHLVAVSPDGGPPQALNYGPARAISFGADQSGTVIGRNSGDPARWKRYLGGTAGTVWVDRGNKGRFSPLVQLKGNLASPMWIDRRIYFLSDHEGHGNLYSCTATGRNLTRHTDQEDFYVRFPKTDGKRVVYHAGADLYVFDPNTNASHKIDVQIHSSQSQRNRKFVGAGRYLETWNLHPKGHSLASVHRGGLFTMGLWTGAPLRLGASSGVRYRLATWLPDGKQIVAITDEGGDEALVVFAVDGSSSPRLIRADLGRPIDLYIAPGNLIKKKADETQKGKTKKVPDGSKSPSKEINRLALTNHRHELILVDLDTGRTRVLDRSRYHRIGGVAWSPDSNWIAYGHSSSEQTSSIRLCQIESGKVATITREDFSDAYPSFDPDGKYLYFVSGRTYNPVYDNLFFDLGFPMGDRPYLVTLQRDTPSPFHSGMEEPRAPGSSAETHPKASEEKHPAFRIDLDGIADRIVAFPVNEGRYSRIVGARGRALYARYPILGSLSEDTASAPEPKGILEYWAFDTHSSGRVTGKVTDFALSLDARVLGIQSGKRIRAVATDFKEDPHKKKDECSRETGWVDLARIPVSVTPRDEWRQMYTEAWRLQKEHFWRADMSGVRWEKVRERYLPVLDRVGTRTEFSDLMWEMQGELGTSHCYEMGGDYRTRPNWRQGFLGADMDFNARTGRWSVTKIPTGDSWDTKQASPLAAPGLNLAPGDELLAVGGDPVNGDTSPYERLVNMADRDVQITVRHRGSKQRSQETLTIRALREETSLRYRNWVEENRRLVHDKTEGRVGYLHIPDMSAAGYAEFHRYYRAESTRDGLIVDVRFNRGGHVSPLLLEKLLRRRIGYDVSRWSEPIPYPYGSPMGPMVALTNEYAGSDGDIFCHSFKLFGLGPLIGMRTWGGVIGIWPRHSLVDGTVTTQPEFAFWFEDVGYGVENYGTEPDIEIDNRPQDYAQGKDRQLERALTSIRGILRKHKPMKPSLNAAAARPPQRRNRKG
jgi:tricorn protease